MDSNHVMLSMLFFFPFYLLPPFFLLVWGWGRGARKQTYTRSVCLNIGMNYRVKTTPHRTIQYNSDLLAAYQAEGVGVSPRH